MGVCSSSPKGDDTLDQLQSHTSFGHVLSPSELSTFSSLFHPVECVEGSSICEANCMGLDFYVLIQGEIHIHVEDNYHCTKMPGDCLPMSRSQKKRERMEGERERDERKEKKKKRKG